MQYVHPAGGSHAARSVMPHTTSILVVGIGEDQGISVTAGGAPPVASSTGAATPAESQTPASTASSGLGGSPQFSTPKLSERQNISIRSTSASTNLSLVSASGSSCEGTTTALPASPPRTSRPGGSSMAADGAGESTGVPAQVLVTLDYTNKAEGSVVPACLHHELVNIATSPRQEVKADAPKVAPTRETEGAVTTTGTEVEETKSATASPPGKADVAQVQPPQRCSFVLCLKENKIRDLNELCAALVEVFSDNRSEMDHDFLGSADEILKSAFSELDYDEDYTTAAGPEYATEAQQRKDIRRKLFEWRHQSPAKVALEETAGGTILLQHMQQDVRPPSTQSSLVATTPRPPTSSSRSADELKAKEGDRTMECQTLTLDLSSNPLTHASSASLATALSTVKKADEIELLLTRTNALNETGPWTEFLRATQHGVPTSSAALLPFSEEAPGAETQVDEMLMLQQQKETIAAITTTLASPVAVRDDDHRDSTSSNNTNLLDPRRKRSSSGATTAFVPGGRMKSPEGTPLGSEQDFDALESAKGTPLLAAEGEDHVSVHQRPVTDRPPFFSPKQPAGVPQVTTPKQHRLVIPSPPEADLAQQPPTATAAASGATADLPLSSPDFGPGVSRVGHPSSWQFPHIMALAEMSMGRSMGGSTGTGSYTGSYGSRTTASIPSALSSMSTASDPPMFLGSFLGELSHLSQTTTASTEGGSIRTDGGGSSGEQQRTDSPRADSTLSATVEETVVTPSAQPQPQAATTGIPSAQVVRQERSTGQGEGAVGAKAMPVFQMMASTVFRSSHVAADSQSLSIRSQSRSFGSKTSGSSASTGESQSATSDKKMTRFPSPQSLENMTASMSLGAGSFFGSVVGDPSFAQLGPSCSDSTVAAHLCDRLYKEWESKQQQQQQQQQAPQALPSNPPEARATPSKEDAPPATAVTETATGAADRPHVHFVSPQRTTVIRSPVVPAPEDVATIGDASSSSTGAIVPQVRSGSTNGSPPPAPLAAEALSVVGQQQPQQESLMRVNPEGLFLATSPSPSKGASPMTSPPESRLPSESPGSGSSKKESRSRSPQEQARTPQKEGKLSEVAPAERFPKLTKLVDNYECYGSVAFHPFLASVSRCQFLTELSLCDCMLNNSSILALCQHGLDGTATGAMVSRKNWNVISSEEHTTGTQSHPYSSTGTSLSCLRVLRLARNSIGSDGLRILCIGIVRRWQTYLASLPQRRASPSGGSSLPERRRQRRVEEEYREKLLAYDATLDEIIHATNLVITERCPAKPSILTPERFRNPIGLEVLDLSGNSLAHISLKTMQEENVYHSRHASSAHRAVVEARLKIQQLSHPSDSESLTGGMPLPSSLRRVRLPPSPAPAVGEEHVYDPTGLIALSKALRFLEDTLTVLAIEDCGFGLPPASVLGQLQPTQPPGPHPSSQQPRRFSTPSSAPGSSTREAGLDFGGMTEVAEAARRCSRMKPPLRKTSPVTDVSSGEQQPQQQQQDSPLGELPVGGGMRGEEGGLRLLKGNHFSKDVVNTLNRASGYKVTGASNAFPPVD